MRRVVITGMGITSCLGCDKESVSASLREGRSGIRANESYKEFGLRCNVSGKIDLDLKKEVDRKALRFMGPASAYAAVAMQRAIEDSGLTEEDVTDERTGVVAGSGGACSSEQVTGCDTLRERGIRRVHPFLVPRVMSSTVSACLATTFKIKGMNYSIASACATSAHCIGHGAEQIAMGKQEIVFAGGGEEESWQLAMGFDAMMALSSKYNDTPETASRPYDMNRDGFVPSLGGGIVVLESLERAQARGANIYAEVVGYGFSSDGDDMVAPSGEGAQRCMQMALETVDAPIDYVNTHGTATPAGDIVELRSLRKIFGDDVPPISSTKSLSGHALGAAGVHEAIYCLLMMQGSFISASANIENIEEEADAYPIVRQVKENATLKTVLSNSFGFGGTNASLILQKI
jgi:3-oxoacyl-[acyl-carrier-protein] synthase I